MVNLPLWHSRQTLPEHTANQATGNTASVNHLLWSGSLSETFRGATFCQRMRYLGEVIAAVVSEKPWKASHLLEHDASWLTDGKMAPDSHLRIYHLQTRQFGMLSCKKQTSRSIQLHQVGWISTFKGIPSLVKWSCYIKNKCHTYETLRLWPLNLFTLKKENWLIHHVW